MTLPGNARARPLEVWTTEDGRVLLHQPGPTKYQPWIEVARGALPWLIEQLERSYSQYAAAESAEGTDELKSFGTESYRETTANGDNECGPGRFAAAPEEL